MENRTHEDEDGMAAGIGVAAGEPLVGATLTCGGVMMVACSSPYHTRHPLSETTRPCTRRGREARMSQRMYPSRSL